MEELRKAAHEAGQKYIDDAKFEDMFNTAIKQAEESVADGLMMQFIMYGRNLKTDEWAMMPAIFGNWPPPEGISKEDACAGMGVKFYEEFPDYKLVAVMHLSESWLVQRKPGEEHNVTPSEEPDRVEAVLVHGMTLDHRVSFNCRKIIRDDSSR